MLGRYILRAETGYAVLLVSAFLLPEWVSYRLWIPALAVAIVLAFAHALIAKRGFVIPAVLVGYLAVYAAAALLSDPDTFSVIEAGKYFAPPVLGIAIASAAQDAETRKRILGLAAIAIAIQLPVVLFQVIDNLIEFGRDAVLGVDSITGLLGTAHGGTLTECAVLAAVIVIAAAYLRVVSPAWGLAVGLVLISFGVLTSTRAVYAFALLALGGIALAMWVVARGSVSRRWLATATVLVVVVPLALVGGIAALYPGANAPFTNFGAFLENLVAAPGAAQVEVEVGGDGEGQEEELAHKPRATVLPGRGRQFTTAFDLTTAGGIDVWLLGRGIGVTRFKSQGVLDETGRSFDSITREEQLTNGTWLSRTLTETGFLGFFAFLGLLVYLLLLTWRNRDLIAERTWDSAVILALPGVAALTVIGAFFNTILAIQPYATLFWPLVGIAIAIDVGRRREAAEPAPS
jgi:hypothetical protein